MLKINLKDRKHKFAGVAMVEYAVLLAISGLLISPAFLNDTDGVKGGIDNVAAVVSEVINGGPMYDADGYDRNGYDKDSYDKNGFNAEGIHKVTGTTVDEHGNDRDGNHVFSQSLSDFAANFWL